jgi:hypothetical protein
MSISLHFSRIAVALRKGLAIQTDEEQLSAYLSDAVDLNDLEQRMREFDRRRYDRASHVGVRWAR